MNKHYTFQEYLEKFTSIQDSYDYYFELQKEIDRLENIIKEVREYIKEHSTTINFKTMRADYNLNMNELLEILDKGEINERSKR